MEEKPRSRRKQDGVTVRGGGRDTAGEGEGEDVGCWFDVDKV